MESTPLLYRTLVEVLNGHQNWLDLRHLKTLAWMINGLIQSGKIGLGSWTVYVHSRAEYAASVIRRFRRFLDNDRIEVDLLYGPLLSQALREWGQQTLYVALDTSMLWDTYCIVRLSATGRSVLDLPGTGHPHRLSATGRSGKSLSTAVPVFLTKPIRRFWIRRLNCCSPFPARSSFWQTGDLQTPH